LGACCQVSFLLHKWLGEERNEKKNVKDYGQKMRTAKGKARDKKRRQKFAQKG
jgi:hypothetical protein